MNVPESTRPAAYADIPRERSVPRGVREQWRRHGEGRSDAVGAICFAQNTRDELRIVSGCVCGAIAANPGMKQQSYIIQTVKEKLK